MKSLIQISRPNRASTARTGSGWRIYKVLAIAILVLMLPVIALCVMDSPAQPTAAGGVDVMPFDSDNPSAEAVTMQIDLEEGGVIDLEMTGRDVEIDTWNGDHVIVIVEKTGSDEQAQQSEAVQPINIKVRRSGRDVHIAAYDRFGNQLSDPTGVAFRIVVPKSAWTTREAKAEYDLTRLTATIFRALRHEALRWIGRS